uniref:GOLD domain-containing protein n=1 Tax=Heterorhabditis bacteriophora TaxID=37862 RepID=A0A1I7XNL0_HETBA
MMRFMRDRRQIQDEPSLLSRFPLQMRLSSPFGEFSEWVEGEEEAKLKHNVTETGDYEICIVSARPVQVNLNIFFHDPEKVEKSFKTYLEAHQMSGNIQKTVNMIFQHVYQAYYSVKYYNKVRWVIYDIVKPHKQPPRRQVKVSVRDQAMQETNSENIRAFGAVGCLATITLSISQVLIVRRMFRVDASRIRI